MLQVLVQTFWRHESRRNKIFIVTGTTLTALAILGLLVIHVVTGDWS